MYTRPPLRSIGSNTQLREEEGICGYLSRIYILVRCKNESWGESVFLLVCQSRGIYSICVYPYAIIISIIIISLNII